MDIDAHVKKLERFRKNVTALLKLNGFDVDDPNFEAELAKRMAPPEREPEPVAEPIPEPAPAQGSQEPAQKPAEDGGTEQPPAKETEPAAS